MWSPADRPVTAIVIGAGQRGKSYATYALEFPQNLQIVGVVEPKKKVLEEFKQKHNIPDARAFQSWQECAESVNEDKFADAVIITTPDAHHAAPAIAFADLKLDILLEKPMATTADDCIAIYKAVKRNGIILAVCHVLRHANAAQVLKKFAEDGSLGTVVNIQHTEPVGFWHFAHSFVRGNWRNEATSTFSLLAKCGHDVDLIAYWNAPKRCVKVTSVGSLRHFKKSEKPEGAGSRCLDCSVEKSCQYSAKKLYLDRAIANPKSAEVWPIAVLRDLEDFNKDNDLIEELTRSLKEGPYGRCVYECDNDVNDNQVVMFEFDDGSTASLTMIAFTQALCDRRTRIFGTAGEIGGNFGDDSLEFCSFDHPQTISRPVPLEKLPAVSTSLLGHGGTDFYLVDAFSKAVSRKDPSLVLTGVEESLRSHLLTFAAEKARKENRVVTVDTDPEFFLLPDE